MMTNQLDYDAQESMNEGRGLCRVLALGVAFLAGAAAAALKKGKDKEGKVKA